MNNNNQNIILHKIKDYIPNEKIQFKKHKITGQLELWFLDKNAIMTIPKEDTWDEIKRHIDAKMSIEKQIECSICSTKTIQFCRVSCNKCASDWCIDCYINIFRTNKGIIKCPFCRYSYGNRLPDNMIEIGVKQILANSLK